MVDNEKPFKLSKQSEDNLSVPPSLSKEYPETGYNFQDTAFLANQLCQTHDNCAFIDTKEVLLSESYTDMYEYIQNSINGKSNVVTGEIFINKDSEMLMLAPILANAVVSETEKIVCPLNLTYPPKESHAVAFCMNKNNDGTYNAVILEQHAQNKIKDKEAYKPELDYSEEISGVLNNISSFLGNYGITVNTKYNEKPICREEKVCGIVSMEACKRLLETDNPVLLAEVGFSLTKEDVEKLHNQNIQNYNRETMRDYVSEDMLSQEIYSFDMVDNEHKVGNIDISIHRKKIVSGDERQSYPSSWFVENTNQLKPVLSIDGLGLFGYQGAGYGRAALQRAYEMSVEQGCEGRIEVPVTWNAGFYEHCGLVGKKVGQPETKYFEPSPENIEKLYKGGKRENLALKIAEPMDLESIRLDDFIEQPEDNNMVDKFDQYGRLRNLNYDPNKETSSDKKRGVSLEVDPETGELIAVPNMVDNEKYKKDKEIFLTPTNPNSPLKKVNLERGEEEYVDPRLQRIHELRKRMQKEHQDPLILKQNVVKQGLKEIGFSENDMGKTGDSRTGEVTEKHYEIAASQSEDAKQFMLRRRLSKGK